MAKSPDAFRTISEVADWLGIQAHVLRFWESKFTQVKPIKRAGGRRYYRPADMLLLGGIKRLLHEDGLTIKGVQKILREEGMSHVATLSEPLDELTQSETDETAIAFAPTEIAEEETGVLLPFAAPKAGTEQQAQPTDTVKDGATDAQPADLSAPSTDQPAKEAHAPAPVPGPDRPEPPAQTDAASPQDNASSPHNTPASVEQAPDGDATSQATVEPASEDVAADAAPHQPTEPAAEVAPVDDGFAGAPEDVPAFLRQPLADDDAAPPHEGSDEANDDAAAASRTVEADPAPTAPEPSAPASPRPRVVDLPPVTAEADFPALPGILTACARSGGFDAATAAKAAPMLARLTAARDRMAAQRGTADAAALKD